MGGFPWIPRFIADLLDNVGLSTDGTFASNSDALIPTQKAVKTYVTANLGSGGTAAAGTDVNTGTDNTKLVTALSLYNSTRYNLTDGQGSNYQIVTSVGSGNLTVSLENQAGNGPSTTDKAIFSCGNQRIEVSTALSVTVPSSLGDIFAWNAGAVQGNDAPLFVYIINNNGTPQLGVSPCPMLLTVANNYYSNSAQTGSAGYTNIVMSGIRNATNSCRNIGMVNVYQNTSGSTWTSPGTALTLNQPTFETGYYYWTPTYGGFSANPTNISRYKICRNDVQLEERETATGTSNAATFTMTAPMVAFNLTNGIWTAVLTQIVDNGVIQSTLGQVYSTYNSNVLNLQKTPGQGPSWTTSGGKRVSFSNFRYQVS